jgi:uncharacterized membrane protein HdeD (DUF308 family)
MDDRQTETVVVVDGRTMAHRFWGLIVTLGIVAAIFGVVVLANIWASVHLVAIFAGLFLAFAGIMQFVNSAGAERKTGRIIAGVLLLIAGLALIFVPEQSVKTVAVIVGAAFIFWGLIMVVAAVIDRGDGWGVAAGFGVLLAIVGLIVVAWPGPTIAILMILVGLDAILFGASLIAQGLVLRRA